MLKVSSAGLLLPSLAKVAPPFRTEQVFTAELLEWCFSCFLRLSQQVPVENPASSNTDNNRRMEMGAMTMEQ